MQAAFLSIKLKHLVAWTELRQKAANHYLLGLRGVDDLALPFTHPLATHVYHLFVIRTEKRDELQSFLSSKGIGTLIHYPIPPHLQKAYHNLGFRKGCDQGDRPVSSPEESQVKRNESQRATQPKEERQRESSRTPGVESRSLCA